MNDKGPRSAGLAAPLIKNGRQQMVLLGVSLLVLAVVYYQTQRFLDANHPQLGGALHGGAIAAAATLAGTLPVLVIQGLSQRVYDALLGFGAGVMLAASAFSLIVPGLEAAREQGAGPWAAALIVSAGILVGAAFLLAIDQGVPHEHFIKGVEGRRAKALKRAWLFVLAIALHNFPEGLAIGVAFAGDDAGSASALATGIAIQDVVEGLVVALALRTVGYSRAISVGLGAASGLIEPLAALFGAALVGISATLLPWGLAMAAGGMLFVISHEIIPESHRQGHEAFATGGLMVGFVVMMMLDTALA